MRRDLIVISAIFLFSICLGLTGCSMSVKDAKSTDENEFERFDTPYTRCEANDDGTYSMYIYAAPVQFKKDNQYYKKDNSIVESPDSKSTYENKENDIKTIISKVLDKGVSIVDDKGEISIELDDCEEFSNGEVNNYTNIFGDTVEAVVYENKKLNRKVIIYPAISGIYVEFECQEGSYMPKIRVKTDAADFEDKKNGYIILKTHDDKKAVIYNPIVKYQDDKEFHFDMKYHCYQKMGGIELQFPINAGENKRAVRVAFSVERYVKKMPDTSLYTKVNINSYLRNYAIIGYHNTFGEGIEYLRFRANYYMNTRPDNIISAEYCMKRLDNC